MTRSDAEDKALVRQFLQIADLEVEDVPESTEQRCDLRAKDVEHNQFLFEVKGFHDATEITAALRRGDDYRQSLQFDSARAVEAGIRTAVNQLESTAGSDLEQLRFLALVVRSKFNAKVVFQQILGHLYGKRTILANPSVPGEPDMHECLYFSHSAFFHHQSRLDGALVSDGEYVTLYLNDYSPRLARVRETALARFFAQEGAIYVAAAFEEQGFLSAIGCDVDRNNESQVLQFVAQKYHLENPRVMNFKRHSGFAVIPWEAQEGMKPGRD